MSIIVGIVILALVVWFLADLTLYSLYSIRKPRLLGMVYGRVRRHRRGPLTLPGRAYRRFRGGIFVILFGSPMEAMRDWNTPDAVRERISPEQIDRGGYPGN